MPSYDILISVLDEGKDRLYQDTYKNYNLLLIEWKTVKTLYAGNHFNHDKTQPVV